MTAHLHDSDSMGVVPITGPCSIPSVTRPAVPSIADTPCTSVWVLSADHVSSRVRIQEGIDGVSVKSSVSIQAQLSPHNSLIRTPGRRQVTLQGFSILHAVS